MADATIFCAKSLSQTQLSRTKLYDYYYHYSCKLQDNNIPPAGYQES